MKRFLVLLLILSAFIGFSAELVVYTSESFSSGIGRIIFPRFEKMYNCKVKVVTFDSMGSALARAISEKNNPKADVIIGLNYNQLQKAVKEGILQKYRPTNSKNVVYKNLLTDYGTPYDFGALAMIYNTESIKNPPKSFKDMLRPEYSKKFALIDPRTSSTGLTFLMWTIAVFGENGFEDYWKQLSKNALTITSGWSAAFKMLETGEVEMIVSFATDGAYSMYKYGSMKYAPIIFEEGAYVLEEYASLTRGAKNSALGRAFLEFILTPDFQKEVPLNQWMLPVINVELPEVFKYVPKIEKVLRVPDAVNDRIDEILKKWEKAVIS